MGLQTLSKKLYTTEKTLVQEPNKHILDTTENCLPFSSPILEQRTNSLFLFESTSQSRDERHKLTRSELQSCKYSSISTDKALQPFQCECHTMITKKNKQKLKIIDTYSLGILYNGIMIMITFPG